MKDKVESFSKVRSDDFEVVPRENGDSDSEVEQVAAPVVKEKKVKKDKRIENPEAKDEVIEEQVSEKKVKKEHSVEKKAEVKVKEKTVKPAVAIDESVPEEKKAEVFSGDKFSDLPINDKLKHALNTNSFTELTEIQKKAIPMII